jgi:hypothetical protein
MKWIIDRSQRSQQRDKRSILLSATVALSNAVYHETDNKKLVAFLFYDMSRAFDCIDIDFLEDKLFNIEIRRHALEFIIEKSSSQSPVLNLIFLTLIPVLIRGR